GKITGTTEDALMYSTQGTHVIHWNFDDGHGNASHVHHNVVITDITAPAAPASLPDVTGECSATATAPTAEDNCSGTITGTTEDALMYSTQGTHVIHWNFDDGHGNVSHVNQNVVIHDVTDPAIVNLPANIVINNDPGTCSAVVSWTAPTASDNCSGSSIQQIEGPVSGANFPAGTTTVTYTATDVAGNTHSESFTVTVNSQPITATLTPGTIACNGGTTTLMVNASGGSGVYIYTLDNGTPQSSATFSNVAAGPHSVVIADVNGCTIQITKNITIDEPAAVTGSISGTSPICTGSSATLTLTVAGIGNISGTLSDGTSFSGTAPTITVSVSPSATTTYTIASMSDAGCTARTEDLTGSATITVNPLPVITTGSYGPLCSNGNSITLNAQPVNGTWSGPGISGNNFNPAIAGPGSHVVTYSYTDANGCTSIKTTTIVVNAAPVVSIAGLNAAYCANSAAVMLTGLPSGGSFTIDGSSATQFDPSALTTGSHSIVYTYTDGNSCTATATQNVMVNAVPSAPTAGPNQAVCEQSPIQTITATASVPAGYHVVWYTQASGGVQSGTHSLNIVGSAIYYAASVNDITGCESTDRTAVSLTIYPAATQLSSLLPITAVADVDCAKEHISFTPPYTISEHCSIAATGIRLNSAGQIDPINTLDSPFPVGTTTIRWEANVNGQLLTSYQQVIVEDKTAPVPKVVNLPAITAQCSATISTIPTATDDCAGTVSATTSSPLSYTTPGNYTIVWVYSDGHGNTATQTQSVTITDDIAPVPNVASLPALSGQCSVTVTDIPKATDNCAGTIIGSTNSPMSFNAPGNYTIVWIYDDGHGNVSTQSQAVTVTGLTAFTVTSTGSVCNGGVTIALASSQTGVTYQLIRDGSVIVDSRSGSDGFGLEFNVQSAGGTYTVRATAPAGCTATMNGSVTLTAATLPTVYNVSGGGTTCGSGGITAITLSNSQTGITYYLLKDGIATGVTRNGITGLGQSFGTPTEAGNYTVLAINAAGCQQVMNGTAVVSIGVPPTVYTVSTSGTPCNGGVHVRLSGSQFGISYVLAQDGFAVGNPVTGSGLGIDFGVQVPGTYTVIAINTNTGCMSNMSGSATVLSGTPPVAFTVTGGGASCSGFAVVGLSGSEAGVSYQLKNGPVNVGSPVSGSGSAISFGVQATGTYTVVATNNATLCTNNMSNSVTVSANAATQITQQPQGQTICSGNTALLSVTASGSGLGYQWQLNGTNIPGATSNVYTASVAGNYSVIVTSDCGTLFSNTAVLTVNTAPLVTTQPADKTICAGSTAIFSVVASGSGTLQYQWRLNNIDIPGANNNFYETSTAGSYTVVVSNSCGNATSNAATLIVNPNVSAGQIVGPTDLGCPGTVVSFTSNGTQNGTWTSSNTAVATVGLNSGIVNCVGGGTSVITYTVNGCGGPQSTSVTVTVTPNAVAGTITGGSLLAICPGTTLVFSSDGTPGGLWSSDNTAVATVNASTGEVTCVAAGNAMITYSVAGCTGPVTTQKQVSVSAPVVIGTQPVSQSICSGTATLSVVASGTIVGYQWQLNGVNISNANASTYTTSTAGNYSVIVIGSCGNVTSNTATLAAGTAPTITTQPVNQTICSGNATFTVAASGTGLSYQWKRGTTNVGTNS
ncbi:MAG: HYR domain-containing protein, partial [Bacteroidetes bacterium]|nr:HYR domain-containing protein [Bacteroidota bacterium]